VGRSLDVLRRSSAAESGEGELRVSSSFYAIWEYSVSFSSDHRTGFFYIFWSKTFTSGVISSPLTA